MAISSGGSSALGQLDLLTPQIQLPANKQLINQSKLDTTAPSNSNDYATIAAAAGGHSLFSNREERKGARFKKNNPSGSNDRGYGK